MVLPTNFDNVNEPLELAVSVTTAKTRQLCKVRPEAYPKVEQLKGALHR
jgi:hypothetical protein